MKFVCLEGEWLRALCLGPLYPLLRRVRPIALAFGLGRRHEAAILAFAGRLRASEVHATIAPDVATLLGLFVRRRLQRQLARDTKTGTAPRFGFVGADPFYRSLAAGRYRDVPRPPPGADIDFLSFIIIDELVHEALHLLFHAQALRGSAPTPHSYFSEEVSVSYWSAVLLPAVFPWLAREHLLRINYDFFLVDSHAQSFRFWDMGHVLASQAKVSPWLDELARALPTRDCYIGERPDAVGFYAELRERPEARFVFAQPAARLRMPTRLAA